MKVLVTGGAGFIGFHLAKHLSKNHDVTICDNLYRGKMDDEFKELIEKSNVDFVKTDLSVMDDVSKLDKDYDQVYHLAAINGTKRFYETPDEVLRVDTLACINILEWFSTCNKKDRKILFSSSSETYAGLSKLDKLPIPTPEVETLVVEDIFNPRWSYGGSKIIGELLFINYSRKRNFRASIIRYHNSYGPRMGTEHVISEFCLRLIRNETPFNIYGGSETRAFDYIEDTVSATEVVMNSEKADDQVVNIGNDSEEITMTDMAKMLFTITGKSPEIKVTDAPEGCVKRRCPDISKLRSLGFEPKTSLKEGLKKTFDWYSNHPG